MVARRFSGSRTTEPKRKRSVVSSVVQVLALGVVCFVVGKMGFLFGTKMLMLIREAHAYRQDIASLRHEAEWYAQQNAALKREEQRLNTRSGVILEARKKGYGFPGERLLVIVPPPTNEPPSH